MMPVMIRSELMTGLSVVTLAASSVLTSSSEAATVR